MTAYYENPTQVCFVDPFESEECGERRWLGGIAHQDFIICGECGGTIELADIDEIIDLPWISISESIIGDGTEINEYETERGITDEVDEAETNEEPSSAENVIMEDGTITNLY